MTVCNICGKECKSVKMHFWKVHGEGAKHKPNAGKRGWNKGLTKLTDSRIASGSLAISKSLAGKDRKPLTEEHKRNIADSRTRYLIANPDKVPYRLNHSSKRSNPEIAFENELISRGITGWVSEYQQSIYNYDFAFIDLKIDVEIDGATHLQEKVKQIDLRRDEFSRSLGWKVIRFTASEIQKDIDGCIGKLLEHGVQALR